MPLLLALTTCEDTPVVGTYPEAPQVEEIAWEGDPDAEKPEPTTPPPLRWAKYCEDIELPDNLPHPDNRPMWWTRNGRVLPKGAKHRKGDVLVRAHAKTSKQWRQDNKRMATMVGSVMAGHAGSVLVKAKLHENRGNFAARHKRTGDLKAARKAYEAHTYKPERVAFLERFIERYGTTKARRAQVLDAKLELARRTRYKDNPHFKDFRRWRAGLGFGFVPPYYLHILDPNEEPEALCHPVNAAYVLINKMRDIQANLIARGAPGHWLNILKSYGTGGDISPRPCKVESDGTERCRDAAKIARLRRLGVDPFEVPYLGIIGNYHYDGDDEKLDPRSRPYARSEETCTTHNSGKPRQHHMWIGGACWYQHVPNAEYLETLHAYVSAEMVKISEARNARTARRKRKHGKR